MRFRFLVAVVASLASTGCAVGNEPASDLFSAQSCGSVQQQLQLADTDLYPGSVLKVQLSGPRVTPNGDGNDDFVSVSALLVGESQDASKLRTSASDLVAEVLTDKCRVINRLDFSAEDALAVARWDGSMGSYRGAEEGFFGFRVIHKPTQTVVANWQVLRLIEEDPCRRSDLRKLKLKPERVPINGGRVDLADLAQNGHLCLSVRNESSQPAQIKLTLNEMERTLGIEPGGRLDLGAPPERVPRKGRVGTVVRHGFEAGGWLVVGGVILPDIDPPPPPPPPLEPRTEPVICQGYVAGYKHPFTPETVPRHRVRRAGLPILCRATFEASHTVMRVVEVGNGIGQTVTYERVIGEATYHAEGVTDAEGRFRIEVFAPDRGIDDKVLSIAGQCDNLSLCGPDATAGFLELDGDEDLIEFSALVAGNVLDVIQPSFGARLITNDPLQLPGGQGLLAISAVSNRPSLGPALVQNKMNDLPVVVHEAYDPLLEDGYQFPVWVLGGQPWDRRRVRADGWPDQNAAPIGIDQICEVDSVGACADGLFGWGPNCNARSCNEQGGSVSCGSDNILEPLLAQGYDVWLVNSRLPQQDLVSMALEAPSLYQAILDYPSRDSRRRVAIGGLSTGGVLARIALRSWEAVTDVQDKGLPAFGQNAGRFADPGKFDATPSRVSLYLSFDSPHLGARVPPALQAYLKDDTLLQDLKPNVEAERLRLLLDHPQAQQLLKNYVPLSVDTPCYSNGGLTQMNIDRAVVPQNCTIDVGDESLTSGGQQVLSTNDMSATEHQRFLDASYFQLGLLGLPEGIRFDALPLTVPSVAISNGSVTQEPRHRSDEVMRVQFEITENDETTFITHRLRESLPQERGSGMGQLCQAATLSASSFATASAKAIIDCAAGAGTDPTDSGVQLSCLIASPGGFLSDLLDKGLDFLTGQDTPLTTVFTSASIAMKPPLGDFPTFVPTHSSLMIPSPSSAVEPGTWSLSDLPRWEDALWRDSNASHFNVEERQCQFLAFHLAAWMKGDRDGFPACPSNAAELSCSEGGMRPGPVLDPGGVFASQSDLFCDADDTQPTVGPIATGAVAE